jgi:hypothetical protein
MVVTTKKEESPNGCLTCLVGSATVTYIVFTCIYLRKYSELAADSDVWLLMLINVILNIFNIMKMSFVHKENIIAACLSFVGGLIYTGFIVNTYTTMNHEEKQIYKDNYTGLWIMFKITYIASIVTLVIIGIIILCTLIVYISSVKSKNTITTQIIARSLTVQAPIEVPVQTTQVTLVENVIV